MVTLVGRDRPAAVLEAEISRTLESHGGLVLVTGEAGIGKTALVTEAMEHAGRRGALVATGTCWDRAGAPGYWPWMQVVRGLRRTMEAEAWAEASAAAGGELAFLLGEAGTARPPAGDDGFGLHDAVTTLLVAAARGRPVVVALDDLQWADAASVRLLEFVTHHTWFERLLLVGSYRAVEVEAAGHPLAPLLAPLMAKATTVSLTGLALDDVGVLLARTTGREPAGELVAEVHRRTGGNPFFVTQTAHLWQSTNSTDAITPGVRDAVARRLALLPAAVVETLTAASVLGPEFHPRLLAASAGLPGPAVDRLLAEAVSARLVVPLDDGLQPARKIDGNPRDGNSGVSLPGRMAFVHDLVRETLYARLDDAAARRRHAAMVKAFERVPEIAAQTPPASLAHHAYHAVPDIAPATAVALLQAAGAEASGRLAFEEAVGHHRRALELVPGDHLREHAAVALQLGMAQQVAGELVACRQTLKDVAAVARKLDDPELLARAALRLRGAAWLSDPEAADHATGLVNEAHGRLAGERAGASGPLTDLDRERDLSARVVALARAAGDDEALWDGLVAYHDAIWAPGTARERARVVDELMAVAHRTGNRYSELFASMLRTGVLLEEGDPGWSREHDALVALARRMDSAFSRDLSRGARWTRAAFTGQFDDARALLEESRVADVRRLGDWQPDDWAALYCQQIWTIELLQGRGGAMEALLGSAAVEGHPHPRLLEAVAAVRWGDTDLALRYLDEVTAAGVPPSRWFLPLWLLFQAEVAAASMDPRRCEDARVRLAPLAGQWLALFGDTPLGPAAHWLAMLDAAQERWDRAVEGFTAAHQAADRLGARPASLEARARLAAALLGRGGPGDAPAAAGLLDEVEREAAGLGMSRVAEHARQSRARLAGTGAETIPGTGAEAAPGGSAQTVPGQDVGAGAGHGATGVFRLLNDRVWTLTFAGRTIHVPDTKGLRDLHVLLGRRGVDVAAAELLNPRGGETARAAAQAGGDAVLDRRALTAYRDRLTQLDERIGEAIDARDDDRAAALDREREALLTELRRATGLGGRPRQLGAPAERARKAVSERIRNTLRRLDRQHPELAAHLRASVSAGTSCRYQPSEDVTWAL